MSYHWVWIYAYGKIDHCDDQAGEPLLDPLMDYCIFSALSTVFYMSSRFMLTLTPEAICLLSSCILSSKFNYSSIYSSLSLLLFFYFTASAFVYYLILLFSKTTVSSMLGFFYFFSLPTHTYFSFWWTIFPSLLFLLLSGFYWVGEAFLEGIGLGGIFLWLLCLLTLNSIIFDGLSVLLSPVAVLLAVICTKFYLGL